MKWSDERLTDLGEFRLLHEVVFPVLAKHGATSFQGHDCSFASVDTTTICLTSDAAPTPLTWLLRPDDYETYGWYAALCNASDLAAGLAKPVGFVSSVEAPGSLKVTELEAFFRGIALACKEHSLALCGGNIRMASRFACHGFAVGQVVASPELRASQGDYIYVIGPSGFFVSSFLKAQADGLSVLSAAEEAALFRPVIPLSKVLNLASEGLIRTASDNSDGLLGAVRNICWRSQCDAILDLTKISAPEYVQLAGKRFAFDWRNILLCWGDWNLCVTVDPGTAARFEVACGRAGLQAIHLGQMATGVGKIWSVTNNGLHEMRVLRNENFVADSYNVSAVEHLNWMLSRPLFDEHAVN